ncbi:ATPase component of various ABC-type transport systems, contain duplicated ATPase [Solibacillus silvestris StLB046]|uniref:ATPase component of various ABC-type transport systems, contain duplicated ATPase n=1 Tax=Solibacillus silvestris (strain StLB046) TaxID=1002809 RepID=F2F4R2_SOLSS|nr:ABC transporter ATP-binding protein [Solibacillus silvestris]BAK16477.1 ATPase component of various ABC-type transport systems, contain duplicated ATPase [Solibacillus silvestris StLB046]
MSKKLLQVKDLRVSFITGEQEFEAVKGVSFHVNEGETVGIVGESGSGKSVTARSIMRLLPSPPSFLKDGTIEFQGENLITQTENQMEAIRGKDISMIFQDPMTSTNPTIRIGDQIAEGIMKHQGLSKKEAHLKTIELLKLVGIKNSEERYNQYPHEFSGGMRQRVMIAMALACNPSLLIADEPTTALDVTIQAQILSLMKDMQQRFGTSIILITHDLGVVAGMCDRVVVMKEGEVVEQGTTEEIFANPQHPYTKRLLNALPKLHEPKQPKELPNLSPDLNINVPLVEVKNISKHFELAKGNVLKAVNDLSFQIYPGETLGLVGESGSGKSTTGRTLLQLHEPTDGEVLYKGVPVSRLTKNELKSMRRHMQIIFQDPYSSLNPRKKILDIIGEALDVHKLSPSKEARRARVEELLELVGLKKEHALRYPHEFSGGQRQRIGIARALAVEPQFIVCDEPLSALDVSIQKQVVDLLKDLQQRLGLTYLFIAHDLSMVKHISDRVAVMYGGKIVELAESEELYANPQHPYTKMLLDSIPIPDPAIEKQKKRHVMTDEELAANRFDVENTELVEVTKGHWVAI